MITRELRLQEYGTALDLAWHVFERFEAPEYSAEGIVNFQKTIRDPEYPTRIRCYGAFEGGALVGMLATRNEGTHITLFFVDEAYHRRGIGKALFALARAEAEAEAITVNSSPYAVDIYQRLGFRATMPEQVMDGIRFTPMIYEMAKQR